jgi:hypothetical protein
MNPDLSNVELYSTALSAVPGPVRISNQHFTLQWCVSVYSKLLLLNFGDQRFFLKINLDQTVRIYDNNLDWKFLNV